ncbi:serine/threonine protein kinase [Aeromonas sobria]|uniref:serine/threonine protein kinase n=1 Tax=Aeromonas sobria TaxID=646 RepID=UPI00111B5541|nr:serine/threonine-protein kinase [Aeromonas sobria]TNH97285.1 hypothetical protein CF137_05240 [Aeromonas sobria]
MMNYSYLSFKGQGGFARVDVVTDQQGQLFAKKTYSPDAQLVRDIGDDHLKRRFIREVKYQSSVQHPNVVEVVEQFLQEDPPYFIMPLADCTLKDELQADATLGKNLMPALFGILAGLEFLHSRGFVHRDLKPANVLRYTRQGSEIIYAISDFGLMSASNSESSTLTGTNANGGTENYAAPEQIGNFRRATASADIYAFGAILHDIFGNRAQRIPYTELTVPGPVGKIIEKCTKRLPIRRYASVSALRDELYQVLNSDTVTFNSSSEEGIVALLHSKTILTDDEWDSVFIQIERNLSQQLNCNIIFSALSIDHINHLFSNSPDLFAAMGGYFAESINGGTFNFDYCDVLASKAEVFYINAELGLKSQIAIALLYLGTSHNRWYVERKVESMLNQNVSLELAERIKIELEVQQVDFRGQIEQMCRSIRVSNSFLHPVLYRML